MMKSEKIFNFNYFSRFLLFLAVSLCLAFPVCAAEKKSDGSPHVFGWQMGLGSSGSFYGDQSIVQYKNDYFSSNETKRFILNSVFEGVFFMNDYISFNLGFLLWFDSFKCIDNTMFILEYDFCSGFRIYPNLKGFGFGIDYVLGGYTNFLKFPAKLQRYNEKGDWANGFKIVLEYNFFENRPGWSPAIGFYWMNMSRNGGWDNEIALYVKACVR